MAKIDMEQGVAARGRQALAHILDELTSIGVDEAVLVVGHRARLVPWVRKHGPVPGAEAAGADQLHVLLDVAQEALGCQPGIEASI